MDSRTLFLCLFVPLLTLSEALADSDFNGPLRARSFHEWMTPSLSTQTKSVPDLRGRNLSPSNLFGTFWADYEIAPDLRILYSQRHLLDFSGAPTTSGMNFQLLDPRFGVRKTQVFDLPGMTTAYDVFIQLPLTAGSQEAGKKFDLGFRTNTTYELPRSRWSVGAIFETFGTFYGSGGKGADVSGFFSPWVSYSLSSTVATQHWVLLPFRHEKGASWSWDMPTNAPILQNGLGIDVSQRLWVSFLINNYLTVAPTLKNTWASLWVSFKWI